MGSKFPLRFRSESLSFSAGNTLSFKNWVPRRGPTGRRVVIDGFFVCADFGDINVVGTAIQGEDWWRAFKRIVIEQTDSRKRWDLRGDESRTMCYLLEGPGYVAEYADSAVAADQDVEIMGYIPMSKRFSLDPTDFALPAESLSEVAITCAELGASELGVSTGTITVDSGDYYIIALCHEEDSIVLKAEDIIKSFGSDNLTTIKVTTGGRLQDLTLMARGASGGASLANLTDVRIDQMFHRAFARDPDLVETYKHARGAATGLNSTIGTAVYSDPHIVNTACPVLFSMASSVKDGAFSNEVRLDLTNTVADLLALARTVVPKSTTLAAQTMNRYRLGPQDFRMKTAKKTRRNPNAWDESEAAYLPMSARDPGNR